MIPASVNVENSLNGAATLLERAAAGVRLVSNVRRANVARTKRTGRPPLRYDYITLTITQRALQGIALGWIFVSVSPPVGSVDSTAAVMAVLCLATAACGMGIGTAVDRWIRTARSSRVATIISLLAIALGLLTGLMISSPNATVISALLIGFGSGTDWSSTAELARQAFPNRRRWYGMRYWTMAFVAGIATVLLIGAGTGVAVTAAIVAIGLIPAYSGLPSPSAENVETAAESPPAERAPAESAAIAQEPASETAETDDNAECDATECCGGSGRAFVAPKFWHGVLLSAIGFAALFGPIALLLSTAAGAADGMSMRIAVAGGLLAGFCLMLNTAPRAGYTITLLPFLTLGVVLSGVLGILETPFEGEWIARFLHAVFAGGVVCGMSALTGELFPDCATDPQRTRTITVALFATTLLLLARGLIGYLTNSTATLHFVDCGVFVVGLLAIRAIPVPVISSLGKADNADDDDEELNDVIASLNA